MSDTNDTAQIVPFQYGDTALRTVTIDGEPWFVAADVARILDYSATSALLRRLDSDDKGVRDLHTPGGVQQMAVISEAGFYVAILGSQSENAKKVKRWLTHEVLPEIRRTGSFNAHPTLVGPELMAAGYVEAMKALGQRDARIHQLEQKATADAPKVTYVDTFVADADCLTFSTVASTLNMQESKLRELLIRKNWIYVQQDSRWSDTHGKKVTRNRYSEKADKKRYFRRVETHEAPRFRGSEVMHTLKITPAGAEAITRLVSKETAA